MTLNVDKQRLTKGANALSSEICAGEIEFGQVWVAPSHALWTFDTRTHTWQHRQCSGELPDPTMCCGLAVVGDYAYTLVNHPDANAYWAEEPDRTFHFEVYMLNLKTWHWERLLCQGDAPTCRARISPTVVQVRNVGGHNKMSSAPNNKGTVCFAWDVIPTCQSLLVT